MPPNANASELRQRSQLLSAKDTADDAATQPTNLRWLKGLNGTEIVIEGVIYDLNDFHHPGGDVVKFFGENLGSLLSSPVPAF